MYNEVLSLTLLEGATIVVFADDIAIIVVQRELIDIQLKGNDAITRVRGRLDENGLELAALKTEVVLISRKRKSEWTEFRVGSFEVESK